MKIVPLLLAAATLLTGCTWGIKLDPAGRNVRVAWTQDVSACKPVGTVTVSVLDHVGPVSRSDLKVRDELEVMARNEAAGLGADTVKPLGNPYGGQQVWNALQCGPLADVPTRKAPTAAETFPLQGH